MASNKMTTTNEIERKKPNWYEQKISNVKHNCVCRLKWWLVWKFGRTFGMLIDINVQCNVFAFGYGRYMPYRDVHTMIWLCPFQIYLASHCEYNFTTVLAKRPIRTGRIDKKKECIHIVSTVHTFMSHLYDK